MKWIFTFCLGFSFLSVLGQISDTTARAIKTLFFEKEIAKVIFYTYEQEGRMPAGTYAFICPDTTFQKVYKGILNEFPYSLATDGLVYKKTLYKDSIRAIYVDGEAGINLQIVFEKISIREKSAEIEFFTTTFSPWAQERFKKRYVRVNGYLSLEYGGWVVKKYKIKPMEWIGYKGRLLKGPIRKNKK